MTNIGELNQISKNLQALSEDFAKLANSQTTSKEALRELREKAYYQFLAIAAL
jgi:hypothetical protein